MSRRRPDTLPNPLPALDAPTLAALRDSIGRHGVLVPVVEDQHGRVLDGHHRRRIAAEFGVHCPVEVVQVRDDDHARELAAELNLVRRHLSPEERRRVVASLRAEGHSTRAIAGVLGVAQTTVQRDVAAGEPGGSPDRTVGLDGKSYPATKPGRRRRERLQPPPPGALLAVHLDTLAADLDAVAADPDLLARVVPERDAEVWRSLLAGLCEKAALVADRFELR